MIFVFVTFFLPIFCSINDLKAKAQVYKESIKSIIKLGNVKFGDYADKTEKLDKAIKGLQEVKNEAEIRGNKVYANELNHTIQTYQGVLNTHKPDSSNDKYVKSTYEKYRNNNCKRDDEKYN